MYVLSREVDTCEEHDVAGWSVAVTANVGRRWAEVRCACGVSARASDDAPEAQRVYRDLLDVATMKLPCPMALSEISARSLL